MSATIQNMSLIRESLIEATKCANELNDRVNKLFVKLSLPLENKVQMDHYGELYLFGTKILTHRGEDRGKGIADDELINIITSAPKKSWDGHIDFFGKWNLTPSSQKDFT